MILVITMGGTWQVIPEVYAALAPGRCRLYAQQPKALGLPEPSEVWVITTSGTTGDEATEAWWTSLGRPVPLRWFRTAASDGNAQAEVELIRELILRVTLHAGPDAVLCLSGGRKTMSADLQRAGMAFGCQAMLHVLPPEGPTPEASRTLSARLQGHDWTRPLPADLPIQVVQVGEGRRSDLLDIAPAIEAAGYPITEGLFLSPDRWLWRDLNARERDGGQLLANFHADLARTEAHENWRSMYRLPPATIAHLRSNPLGPQHRDWLVTLPKAELHCHIGGVLDLEDQCRLGKAVWDSLPTHVHDQAGTDGQAWLNHADLSTSRRWPAGLPPQRKANAAAWILAHTEASVLESRLWPPALHRLALKDHQLGFAAYSDPGELVGSTILQSPAATWAYGRILLDRCDRDGIAYLELRCSPGKYHAGFLDALYHSLQHDEQPGDPVVRVIVIADRRQGDAAVLQAVDLALAARDRLGPFIAGLDLAGDESTGDPATLAPAFTRAFAACLPITIHAGEGQPAANIWKSAYHLHADRIGHGLTLADAPDLARRFRDRRICLELCPTSNREVVGYRDPAHPGSDQPYPLRRLMDLGVPLTLCTDNPGISRTTLADEYLTAARMAGLTCWEALALMKQAYLHAFLPAHERESLIKRIDAYLFNRLSQDPSCPAP